MRIPVGYWLLPSCNDEFQHFSNYYRIALQILQKVFGWAEKYKIGVLLCLHGAPGSQNGEHHSGIADRRWFKDNAFQSQTLDVLLQFVLRFDHWSNFIGIELMNEPTVWADRSKDLSTLKEFYAKAYHFLRERCGFDFAIVFSDAFLPTEWEGVLDLPKHKGVVMDYHHYPIHDKALKFCKPYEVIQKQLEVEKKLKAITNNPIDENARQLIVGEWSLAMHNHQLSDLDNNARDSIFQQFGASQMEAFNSTMGWFFWNFKISRDDYIPWDFKRCVQNGYLLNTFAKELKVQECASVMMNNLKKSAETHFLYWKGYVDESSTRWHYEEGFKQGCTQLKFAARGDIVGASSELAFQQTEVHLNYWKKLGQDFTSIGWHFRHGYIHGLQKSVKKSFLNELFQYLDMFFIFLDIISWLP